MHYHLEIIMPPTDKVEDSVAEILTPFSENYKDEDGESNKYAFYDWYQIGGRFSGEKAMASINPEKLDKFYELLKEKKITISSLTMGKQTLQPASQIPTVNALWVEYFPESPIKECPIFDNYKGANGDIQKFCEVVPSLQCSAIIVAAMDYKYEKMEAKFMIQDSTYNGVSWIDTKWDGTFGDAVKMHLEHMKGYKEDAKTKYTPKENWIVVTVDYHD